MQVRPNTHQIGWLIAAVVAMMLQRAFSVTSKAPLHITPPSPYCKVTDRWTDLTLFLHHTDTAGLSKNLKFGLIDPKHGSPLVSCSFLVCLGINNPLLLVAFPQLFFFL